MRITSLVENTSRKGLPVEHGLSLYIETNHGQTILFDMGQSSLFADNAERLGLSIGDVDIAIISHGHYDHGGGLRHFLSLNQKAKIYIHKDAFTPHYSLRDTGLHYIGLDVSISDHQQIVHCEEHTVLDDRITLFADVNGDCCYPVGNRLLFSVQDGVSGDAQRRINDDFYHEQNLILQTEGKTILFAGCAHRGIVNILRHATDLIGHAPTHVFAGMHLVKSGLSETEEESFIRDLAQYLSSYSDCKFFTMHCTGTMQFEMLRRLMGEQIEYLSCGDSVEI